VPATTPSNAPIELTLDLRNTPPDKVLSRLLGALDRVSQDVTLLVLIRDTPEYAGVSASIYQTLRGQGYFSDSSRMPQGCQRLCIRRRPGSGRGAARLSQEAETVYAPAPESLDPASNRFNGAAALQDDRVSGWDRSSDLAVPSPQRDSPPQSGDAVERER